MPTITRSAKVVNEMNELNMADLTIDNGQQAVDVDDDELVHANETDDVFEDGADQDPVRSDDEEDEADELEDNDKLGARRAAIARRRLSRVAADDDQVDEEDDAHAEVAVQDPLLASKL